MVMCKLGWPHNVLESVYCLSLFCSASLFPVYKNKYSRISWFRSAPRRLIFRVWCHIRNKNVELSLLQGLSGCIRSFWKWNYLIGLDYSSTVVHVAICSKIFILSLMKFKNLRRWTLKSILHKYRVPYLAGRLLLGFRTTFRKTECVQLFGGFFHGICFASQ